MELSAKQIAVCKRLKQKAFSGKPTICYNCDNPATFNIQRNWIIYRFNPVTEAWSKPQIEIGDPMGHYFLCVECFQLWDKGELAL